MFNVDLLLSAPVTRYIKSAVVASIPLSIKAENAASGISKASPYTVLLPNKSEAIIPLISLTSFHKD
jgi:hypothetical protein